MENPHPQRHPLVHSLPRAGYPGEGNDYTGGTRIEIIEILNRAHYLQGRVLLAFPEAPTGMVSSFRTHYFFHQLSILLDWE